MASIHRSNIGNVDVIEEVIRKFAETNGCIVGYIQDHVPYKPDFPDWKLTQADRHAQIQIEPNVWAGCIGIHICPFREDGKLVKKACNTFGASSDEEFTRQTLHESLIKASKALGWPTQSL